MDAVARQAPKSLLSADITRSMQHKHEEYAKLHTQNKLLAQLDVLFEPSVMLPLWRRVDRRFWWNEWLSKPLIDAGVSASGYET